MTDVLIVGSSVSGLLAAATLRKRVPDAQVTVVGPAEERRPIVGESLVEPAMLLLVDLGLEPWLREHCALKNGLTFYHKLRIGDPTDRRYSLHAPEALHYLSRQLHRPDFDARLRRHAEAAGVRFEVGRVRAVEAGRHDHRVELDDGRTLRGRFLIDASGRSRVVGKQVTTYDRPEREAQRSSLWFRLVDFEPFVEHLELSARRPLAYDVWDSTHHFMGTGYWIWGIPQKSAEHERQISVGITWRPDLLDAPLRDVDDFLALVEREHPAVAEMVRSGRVLDVQTYRSYLYAARQVYSEDGWFLVGDAARAVDPLYSTGLSMTAIQVEQVASLVAAGTPSREHVARLEAGWRAIAETRQRDITDQYATMHDPLQACMRRYWNLCGWFNAVLPLWFNGYLLEPGCAAWLARHIASAGPANEAAWELFADVSAAVGPVEQAVFDRTMDFDELLNQAFDCAPDEVPDHLGRMLRKRATLRWSLIRIGGWRLLPGQLRWLLRERLGALLLPGRLRRVEGYDRVRRALTFPESRPRLSCLGDPEAHPARRAARRAGLG